MHLAQLNIGRLLAPLESPKIKDFADNLAPINALAETSPGFVWRYTDESGNATDTHIFNEPTMIINLSVWEDVDALKNFMFKTLHANFMKRRAEWFERLEEINHALWWIDEGHLPTLEEAQERILYLRQHGESPQAFSLRKTFDYNDL